MLQERQRQQQKAAHEMAAQDSVAQSVSAGPLFSTVHADVRRVPVERGGDGSCRAGGRGEKGCKDFGPWCPQILRERVLLGFWTKGRSVAGALVLAHSLFGRALTPVCSHAIDHPISISRAYALQAVNKAGSSILDKRKIAELVEQVSPGDTVAPEVEEVNAAASSLSSLPPSLHPSIHPFLLSFFPSLLLLPFKSPMHQPLLLCPHPTCLAHSS